MDPKSVPARAHHRSSPRLKELTLVGYCTSEIGASQELKYVHVAGRCDGDVPYEQVGRAYS